jgi:RimJ/RimL family protein N-acetyltransferase
VSVKETNARPTLETPRLILRPFALADAPDVQRLANDRDIASTTMNIPHPYEEGMAEAWITMQDARFALGELVVFAIVARATRTLLGSIGLTIQAEHERAELGYWMGKPFWGGGYCTEAAAAVVGYAFETLALNRVYAHHLTRNPASGRVMQKIGMHHEGRLRQHVKKWGVLEDLETYSILRREWSPV